MSPDYSSDPSNRSTEPRVPAAQTLVQLGHASQCMCRAVQESSAAPMSARLPPLKLAHGAQFVGHNLEDSRGFVALCLLANNWISPVCQIRHHCC